MQKKAELRVRPCKWGLILRSMSRGHAGPGVYEGGADHRIIVETMETLKREY